MPTRPLKERPVEDRLKDFDSAELVYEEKDALIEARRCLHCGRGAEVIDRKCIRCLTCVRCCPFLVPHMENQAVFPEETCIACGFCASQCPAYAINIRRLEPLDMRQRSGGDPDERAPGDNLCLYARDNQPGGTPGSGHGVVGLSEDSPAGRPPGPF